MRVDLCSAPAERQPQSMPPLLSVLAGGGAAVLAALVAFEVGWHAVPDPWYFLPIAVFAWRGNRKAAAAAVTFGVFGFAMVAGRRAAEDPALAMSHGGIVVQAAASIGMMLVADGAHRLLTTCRRGKAPASVEDDAARARSEMRRINADGRPRSRGNMDGKA